MATYPFEVQLAWDVVNQFTIDWQASPFAWEREVDVQAELFNRLRLIMKYTGREMVSINPPIVRVTQEPTIKYQYSDGKEYPCYPDILIRNAPDSEFKNSWACELKFDNSRGKDWDIEKLQYLCDQKIVHYGLSLIHI